MNSVRARPQRLLTRFQNVQPDIVCLQALKARVMGMLNPAQKAAFEKAAAAQIAAERAAKDKPKGQDKPKGADKPKGPHKAKCPAKPEGSK